MSMRMPARLTALGATAALVGGTVLVAAPAEAKPVSLKSSYTVHHGAG